LNAPTTTTASNATATFSSSNQNVTLRATVTSTAGAVNAGTVTFVVSQGMTQVGTSVTSGTVSNGSASANFTLPGGTAAGTCTITATYNPGIGFAGSSDNTHTLAVSQANTTTTAANAIATFSATTQNVTLSATVTSTAGAVNGGTVTFTLSGVAGSATSGTVSGGSASATFLLPGNTPVGIYTITATYNGSTNFAGSSDTTHTLAVVLNVSGQVSVTQTGFAVNHATNLWTSTLTVRNTSAAPIGGPIEVVLTNLSSNATMTNETGAFGGNPYIIVSAGTLAAGASVSAPIQFSNPTKGSITFTPVVYSGAF
jgi:hypothetical protein